jgi:RNA polymerase sigma-70 factor (ECF subfamily)
MNDINEILIRAKSGDSEAFALIYKEYYVPIYRFIHQRTRSKEQTEDLTQDVFLKIYRTIDSIDATVTSPIGYFYTIARNTLIDYWRKKSTGTVSDDELMSEIRDERPSALDNASLKEQSSLLYQCLEELTDEQREVVSLRFIQELTTAEIAAQLGKKETAVRQLQVRGLRTLSKIFKQKYDH